MSYLKTLLSKDVIVTPFKVHKSYSDPNNITTNVYDPNRPYSFQGENTDYPLVADSSYSTVSQSWITSCIAVPNVK